MKLEDVYGIFLSKVNDDEWAGQYTEEDLEYFTKDWRMLLDSAIYYFKFPRCSLKINEEKGCFEDKNFGREEAEVLANFMKLLWLKRTIDSWENIKTQYSESDFSQANLLKTFISLRNTVNEETLNVERLYSRSVDKKPFSYKKLAGGGAKYGRY